MLTQLFIVNLILKCYNNEINILFLNKKNVQSALQTEDNKRYPK
jgi:hypothetical protein